MLHSCNWELKTDALNVKSGINYELFMKGLLKDTINRISRSSTEDEVRLPHYFSIACTFRYRFLVQVFLLSLMADLSVI